MKKVACILLLYILYFSSYGNEACKNIEPISFPDLEYPDFRIPKYVEGEIELSFIINEKGMAKNVRVLRYAANYKHESFSNKLKDNAVSVVKKTLYTKPESSCMKALSIKFSMEDA